MLEKHIGRALAEVRNAKGLTQREIGESVGVNLGWVSALENGRKNLNLAILQKLCDALEVSIIDITDMAYATYREETLQSLRETGGRLPDDQAVSLSDLEDRVRQFTQGFENLFHDGIRFIRQPARMEMLERRFAPARPLDPPPSPPRRRGRPPASANTAPGKGSPAGKGR